jgi:NAD(P)-dependent dehydrogenase (short-subunit alcohol dehydrogenase family)
MDVGDLHGKTALVTGAASGIGRATALALARAGADLVLGDLNEVGLAETAEAIRGLGRQVVSHRLDVADREAMRAFAADVGRHCGAVDLLVNNAGVGVGGDFLDTPLEDWDWVISINLMGVVHGCHFLVPPMVARGRGGHVVNIASAAGLVATRELPAYSATKFAVVGLSEALRAELRPHGIGVTAVCPGLIDTPITTSSRMRGRAATSEYRSNLVELYRRRAYPPERVAENILRAIAKNRGIAPITPEAWVLYVLKRLSPRLTDAVGRAATARVEREIAARQRAATQRR